VNFISTDSSRALVKSCSLLRVSIEGQFGPSSQIQSGSPLALGAGASLQFSSIIFKYRLLSSSSDVSTTPGESQYEHGYLIGMAVQHEHLFLAALLGVASIRHFSSGSLLSVDTIGTGALWELDRQFRVNYDQTLGLAYELDVMFFSLPTITGISGAFGIEIEGNVSRSDPNFATLVTLKLNFSPQFEF